jgi:hypothetical protein
MIYDALSESQAHLARLLAYHEAAAEIARSDPAMYGRLVEVLEEHYCDEAKAKLAAYDVCRDEARAELRQLLACADKGGKWGAAS